MITVTGSRTAVVLSITLPARGAGVETNVVDRGIFLTWHRNFCPNARSPPEWHTTCFTI
jgi:hypothetical protein